MMTTELTAQMEATIARLETWATDPTRARTERADLSAEVWRLAWDLEAAGELTWTRERPEAVTFDQLESDDDWPPSVWRSRPNWCHRLTLCLDPDGAAELLEEVDLVTSRYVTNR